MDSSTVAALGKKTFYTWFLLFIFIPIVGWGQNDALLSAGVFQIGSSGGTCSFFTSLLVGPRAGRGRNQGELKSLPERWRLIPLIGPLFTVPQAYAAYFGATYETYRDVDVRSALNLNIFSDVRQTITLCDSRGLIDSSRANRLRQHLVHCNYLTADMLLDALSHQAVTEEEARVLFFEMLRIQGNWADINLYLHVGNSHLVSRLDRAGVLNSGEAVGILVRYIVSLPRLSPTLLEDISHYGFLSKVEFSCLLSRERMIFMEFSDKSGLDVFSAQELRSAKGSKREVASGINQLKDRLLRLPCFDAIVEAVQGNG